MPVELILAPPASGKTTACIQRIRSVQQTDPLAPIWVLVPDAQNVTYFSHHLARAGGGLGVNVGTFHSLYTDLLERQGYFTSVITPGLEHRLVQQTVNAAFASGELTHYAAIKNKPGFISALQDIFSELRSAYISPEQFNTYTREESPPKRELAYLYTHFVALLKEIGWIDRDGQIWGAISALQSEPKAATHIRLLVVDGFNAFAGARLHFLKHLSNHVGEMVITLPGQNNSTRPVHRRAQPVIRALLQELSPQLTELTTTPYLPPESLYLEQHVLDPGEFPKIQTSTPIFLEAQSQAEEAREALRWIKGLHIRHGVPLSDCALYVSQLESYRPNLRAAADEFGIKIQFSHPDPLTTSPAVRLLLNLLELPLEDFKTRAVFNALRSPYLNFKLEAEDIDHLELISQKTRIVSGYDQWVEAWEMLSKKYQDIEESLDEERHEHSPLHGVDLIKLEKQFTNFWRVFDNVGDNRSLTEWVTWLNTVLADLGFYDQLSGERDLEAWATLGESLGALVLSEQVLSEQRVDYEHFLSDLIGAVQGARLDAPRDARTNAIWVSGINHAVASRFEAVALLGFSEGLFPAVEHPDPFLDEDTRADLGLDPQLGREQANTFYQAITRAKRHLLLTRPYLADHGESWDPSPFWQAATSLFKKDALQKINPNKIRPQADAASIEELLFWAVQQADLDYQSDEILLSHWQNLRIARVILKARRSKQPGSIYEGDAKLIAPALAKKYTPDHTWSASRLENYATCPHQFYTQNVLGLEIKETPELGLDPAQIGTILHAILEKVYKEADTTTDLESLLAVLEDCAASVFATAPHILGFRPSPLWQVEQAQFVEMLRNTIEALHTESKGWTPIRFEAKFGIQNKPALQLDLGEETIFLHGVIDRVDVNGLGRIRVIDYKTGSSHLSKGDLISGRRLQLPIYAMAAERALDLGVVIEGFYWQIRDGKASPLKLSKFKNEALKGPEGANTITIDHIKQNLLGIRAGQFPPIPPKGGCPKYCPAVQWCWRYQAGY